MSLRVVPCTLREARAFVAQHHRHHKAPQGGLFAVAVAVGEEVRGVAIVGRPVARMLDDGWTAEVTRLCTRGSSAGKSANPAKPETYLSRRKKKHRCA